MLVIPAGWGSQEAHEWRAAPTPPRAHPHTADWMKTAYKTL